MFSLFCIFLRLGCTSFGGPVAHLGYFHREFVVERKWFTDAEYTELLALCHFLPGPASSQVGMAVGYRQAGIIGSLVAFLGFTLPSVVLMILAALGMQYASDITFLDGILHAMKLLAVAVVVDAIWGMAKKICITRLKFSMTLFTAVVLLLFPGLYTQLMAIGIAALIGAVMLRQGTPSVEPLVSETRHSLTGVFLAVFLLLLVGLPWFALDRSHELISVFDAFYRSGALVFGGGHVVLPMLQAEPLVAASVPQEQFLTAYSLAQAVPGPMFTIASYLGYVINQSWIGGVVATLAIFMPGWLLILAALSVWPALKSTPWVSGMVQGIVPATVGLLIAALYQPVFVSAVMSAQDMAAVLLIWAAISIARMPIWSVVLLTVIAGGVFYG